MTHLCWEPLILCWEPLIQDTRERGCNGYQNPQERGEEQAGDGDGLKRDGDDVRLMQRQRHVQGSPVGDEFNAPDDDGGEQEGQDREGADAEQEDVDGAGDALTAAAVAALGEMLFVVGSHGRGEAGDVEAPAGEDAADDRIRAGGRAHACE